MASYTVLPLYIQRCNCSNLCQTGQLKDWVQWFFVSVFVVVAILFSVIPNVINVNPTCIRQRSINSALRRFSHTNGTLLTPQGQDKRWEEYQQHYISYQSRLSNSSYEYYVIYHTTYSGIANKINGLLSSLLLAMITNRGFKLADWPSFDSYFLLPLANHHVSEKSSGGSKLRLWHRCVEVGSLKRKPINSEYGDQSIHVITNCPLYLSIVKNDLYYEDFVNRGLVRTARKGDYDAIASEVYYRLLNFIHLENTLQEKLDHISKDWDQRFVVGLQIRIGLGNSNFLDNCKFLFERDVNTFIHYAQYFSNRTALKPLWFVSTDSPHVEEMLAHRYPDYVVSIKDLPLMHTKSLVYQYSDPASQRAVLDNYLLSKSDLLITTAWSSFGEVALGRMTSGSTILITRSDPIVNPPPLIHFNRSAVCNVC